MILSTIGLALFGYFAGVLAVMLVGSLWLALKVDRDDTLGSLPGFMKGYEALQSVAWRWPIVLPMAFAASIGVVIGFTLGRILRCLRRACRRITG